MHDDPDPNVQNYTGYFGGSPRAFTIFSGNWRWSVQIHVGQFAVAFDLPRAAYFTSSSTRSLASYPTKVHPNTHRLSSLVSAPSITCFHLSQSSLYPSRSSSVAVRRCNCCDLPTTIFLEHVGRCSRLRLPSTAPHMFRNIPPIPSPD